MRESLSSCCCLASASTTDDEIGEANGVKGVESMLPRPSVPGLMSPPAAYLISSTDEVKGRILLASPTDLPPRTWACCSCCWCWYCCLCWCRPWWWWAALRLPRSWLGLLLLLRDKLAGARMLPGVDIVLGMSEDAALLVLVQKV